MLRRLFGKDGGHHPDYFLLATLFLLVVAGLAILTSASSDLGKVKFNDSYYYLKHQLVSGFLVGGLGFLIAAYVPYKSYKSLAFLFLILNLVLLVLVFTPLGHTAGGASRWIDAGPVTFQPAELLKLSFILYVAAFFSDTRRNRAKNIRSGLLPFLLVAGTMTVLLILQPATSTVMILLAAGLVILFLSGVSWKHLGMIMGGGVVLLGLLIATTSYRLQRIVSYFDHSSDTQGANYQVNQSMIALGSGGVFGLGYGRSTVKVSRLPAVVDDSIFAVVGQELGFVGTGSLVALFAILVARLFWLARETRDRFGRLALLGFASIIALQSLVNMGAISGLLPLTGVPLPFVSYGGTALAVFLTMGGVAVNISKHT
jgi:cell division protein FtsW